MLRHVTKPLHARGFQADVRTEAAGDRTVDDGLPLLVQERDQLPLAIDTAPDATVGVVEEANDGRTFGPGWLHYLHREQFRIGTVQRMCFPVQELRAPVEPLKEDSTNILAGPVRFEQVGDSPGLRKQERDLCQYAR